MASFLLNGTGGYIVTEFADKIIIDTSADLIEDFDVSAASPRWAVWPSSSRWEAHTASSHWHTNPAGSRWEVDT